MVRELLWKCFFLWLLHLMLPCNWRNCTFFFFFVHVANQILWKYLDALLACLYFIHMSLVNPKIFAFLLALSFINPNLANRPHLQRRCKSWAFLLSFTGTPESPQCALSAAVSCQNAVVTAILSYTEHVAQRLFWGESLQLLLLSV